MDKCLLSNKSNYSIDSHVQFKSVVQACIYNNYERGKLYIMN